MFTTKPKPLSLTQFENYSFGASFDKISSNNDKIFKSFRDLKTPQANWCGNYKKVDTVFKKYDMLLNTGLI